MRDPQDIFNEISRLKDEIKSIRKDYRDMLANDADYQRIKDDYDAARTAKKHAEQAVQASMGGAYERLQELMNERRALEEMLSDIAMSQMLEGQSIELADADHNTYVPHYKVTFKKAA